MSFVEPADAGAAFLRVLDDADEADALRQRVTVLEVVMSDAVEYIGARLSLLADWLDSKFGDAGKNDEVQRDLRRWARQFIEQPVTSELAARDERITELTAEVERLKVELRRLTQNVESSVKACHPPISRHYFVTEATKDDIERIRTLLDPPPIASQPTAAELAAAEAIIAEVRGLLAYGRFCAKFPEHHNGLLNRIVELDNARRANP